tara:strand:- start:567 stop:1727 length:1161 start_codon:yes stop_codon:yes gene_type:complete
MKLKRILLTAAMVATASAAMADPQGVYDDKIVIGTHTDLSGPLAIWGVPATNGLKMRIEEANATGGVHGRKIELVVEDTQYQVPLAVRATNKMVSQDKIFAMLMGVGTPGNMASMQILDKKGIPNLFPLTAAASMVEPLSPLHFMYFTSYQNQARGAVKYFAAQGATKLCLQSVASDYGQEVSEGVEAAVDELGLEIVIHGTHKTTETEFAGAATAIKNTDCDVLVLGTTIKDTIAIYATLRKLGWDKPIVGNMVAYMPLVAEAGDGVTDGLYLASPFLIADFEDGDPWRADFHKRYTEQFGEAAAAQAQLGYNSADLFLEALERAGRDLTVKGLTAALESIQGYEDKFGGPSISFGPAKHAGGNALVLVQSRNKGWELIEANLPY